MKKPTEGSQSRRGFLKSAFAVGVTAAAVIPIEQIHALSEKRPPANNASARQLVFFRSDEAQFVSAAVDRFIPPDEEWPGAADAGVVEYIDRQMAGKWGSAGYMYWHGPFKQGTPSQGYQLPFTPAELFRRAIAAINEHFAAQGKSFHLLSPEEQDQYLQMLMSNGTTLNSIPSKTFADLLRQHTIEGFFADPIYGGNKNMVGWRMLGFPGPYGNYYELIDQYGIKLDREPVSIADGPRHGAMQRQE